MATTKSRVRQWRRRIPAIVVALLVSLSLAPATKVVAATIGFAQPSRWSDLLCIEGQECGLADVNGDGRADAVAFVKSTQAGVLFGDVYVALSTGSGFGGNQKWSDLMCVGDEDCGLADVNGDGRADAVAFVKSPGATHGDVYVALAPAVPSGAQLPGFYQGTINSDSATTGVALDVSGQPSDVTMTVELAAGARVACHGNHVLGARTIPLTGHRTGVSADGSSTYQLSGQFEFDAAVHVVVEVRINAATLSADGQTLTGTVGLLIRPEYISDCARSWTFTTTRVPPLSVPSVVDMTVAQAQSTLTAAGLRASVGYVVDMMCNITPGTIRKHSPGAGTVVPHNTPVQLEAISGWPSTCP
jgi:hypothetical protein